MVGLRHGPQADEAATLWEILDRAGLLIGHPRVAARVSVAAASAAAVVVSVAVAAVASVAVAGRGGGGRGGGGRRSDITLKHDIVLLDHLSNGLGYYRFSYNGSNRLYVGVMAQEVQTVMPKAVVRDRDGTLRVLYDRLGIRFQTYEQWIASGARLPAARIH